MPKITKASVWLRPAQFSDNRADHAKKYQRLAFLKIGKRIGKRRAPRVPRDCIRTAHCQA